MVPWKLILFLVLLTIFVVFAGLNINNVADISVGFATVKDVPIFLSVFIAFLAGAFFMLPFAFRKKRKLKKKAFSDEMPQPEQPQTGNPLHLQNDIIEEDHPSDIEKDELD